MRVELGLALTENTNCQVRTMYSCLFCGDSVVSVGNFLVACHSPVLLSAKVTFHFTYWFYWTPEAPKGRTVRCR